MNFLFWFFTVWFGLWLFFRLFGRLILQLMVRWLHKKAQKAMDRQSQQYQDIFSNNPYQDSIRTREGEQVIIPKSGEKKKPDLSKLGDNVDFEEV